MPLPVGWSIRYSFNGQTRIFQGVSNVRGICPHCQTATTFALLAFDSERRSELANVRLLLQCNYADCRRVSYAFIALTPQHEPIELGFFTHPSGQIDSVHEAVPAAVAADWIEAQHTFSIHSFKAAAMMCRRVLYGVVLDKGCPEHPLRTGLSQLIQQERLPGIFDEWLNAIKDDGHDAAHPVRALDVSVENIAETVEYTRELLRFVYIEPWEFRKRKARLRAT